MNIEVQLSLSQGVPEMTCNYASRRHATDTKVTLGTVNASKG